MQLYEVDPLPAEIWVEQGSMTGKLVGSTEGCWMKELEVDGAIGVGAVV